MLRVKNVIKKIRKFDDTLDVIKSLQNGHVLQFTIDYDFIVLKKNELYNAFTESTITTDEWNIQAYLWKHRFHVNRGTLYESFEDFRDSF